MTDFERVYEENQPLIFKYLRKLCGNAELAEELTQETFFRAYMNYGQLRNKSKVSAWLCQIAKHTYYAWYNEFKKNTPLEEDVLVGLPDIADSFVEKELSEEAFRRLQELGEPYKEVFLLSVFAGLSFREISELFQKSESWARVTFHRARKKLMEGLR